MYQKKKKNSKRSQFQLLCHTHFHIDPRLQHPELSNPPLLQMIDSTSSGGSWRVCVKDERPGSSKCFSLPHEYDLRDFISRLPRHSYHCCASVKYNFGFKWYAKSQHLRFTTSLEYSELFSSFDDRHRATRELPRRHEPPNAGVRWSREAAERNCMVRALNLVVVARPVAIASGEKLVGDEL